MEAKTVAEVENFLSRFSQSYTVHAYEGEGGSTINVCDAHGRIVGDIETSPLGSQGNK